MSRRPRLSALLYGAGASVYLLDRITKVLAQDHLRGRPPIVLIPRVLSLDYTTNSGGAFGLFGSQAWLFFAATAGVCLAIVAFSRRMSSVGGAVGLGMILGGAVGNLTDRILNGPGVSGRVVDFIHLHLWPVFNLADTSIVIGAAIVVLVGARRAK